MPLPRAVRFYLTHIAVGFALARVFVAALLWADPGGLGHLLLTAAGSPWPVALLWFFCGLTMAGVQTAIAALLLAEPPDRDDDDNHGGGTPVPIAVRAR